jgi:ornithine carrier protein
LNALELMASGAAAGVTYNCVLFPADCIKSTIQTEDELRPGRRRTFLQVGKDIYGAKGIRGLYSGCGLTALRAAPSSALIFYMYVSLAPM